MYIFIDKNNLVESKTHNDLFNNHYEKSTEKKKGIYRVIKGNIIPINVTLCPFKDEDIKSKFKQRIINR